MACKSYIDRATGKIIREYRDTVVLHLRDAVGKTQVVTCSVDLVNKYIDGQPEKEEIMGDKYYLDRVTGEITWDHTEAVSWYRNGDEVEIWKNGKMVLAWVM